MTDAETLEFTLRVLRAFGGVRDDLAETDDLWWRTDGEYAPVTFFVKCSDVFEWGCADLEQITPENIHVLEQATKDCEGAMKFGAVYAGILFCCRVRGMRPQGAIYDHYDKGMWHLLDAAGPPREVGFGNPRKHPSEREAPPCPIADA